MVKIEAFVDVVDVMRPVVVPADVVSVERVESTVRRCELFRVVTEVPFSLVVIEDELVRLNKCILK